MHDERKVKGEVDEKVKEQTRQLIAKFREVYADVFRQKAEGKMSPDVLKKIDALLELNPELYTVFNYRRQLLLHGWELAERAEKEAMAAALKKDDDETKGSADADAAEEKSSAEAPTPSLLSSSSPSPSPSSSSGVPTTVVISAKQKQLEDMEREIKLNTKILLKDYKVYSAWLHRRWLFMRMSSAMKKMFLAKERQQCEGLLNVDERNFHAWGYRRWVLNEQRRLANAEVVAASAATTTSHAEGSSAATAGASTSCTTTISAKKKAIGDEHNAKERVFTLAKIERNISNYSAWHSRGLIFVERLASIGLAPDELMVGVGRSGVVETLGVPLKTAEEEGASSPYSFNNNCGGGNDDNGEEEEEEEDPINALAEDVIGLVVDDVMVDVELCTKAFFNDPDDQSTWLYADRLTRLLKYASDKIVAARRAPLKSQKGGGGNNNEEEGEGSSPSAVGFSTYTVPADLLDPSGPCRRAITVSEDASLLLEECLASCVNELAECCKALRAEALRGVAEGAPVEKGLKGFQWPTWLLLNLPSAVEDSAVRQQYWKELAAVDPQRRGYYTDMATAERS